MEFIQENYIWLIVAAVILLMIIIGYIADKSEKFGKEKPVKEKKEKKIKEEVKIEETKNDLNVESENSLDSFDMKPEIEPVELEKEELANSNEWDEIPVEVENKEPISEELEDNEEQEGMDTSFADDWDNDLEKVNIEPVEPIELIESETDNNENNLSNEWNDNSKKSESNIEQELDEEIDKSNLNEEKKSDIEDLEITLPNIETLNEEIKDVVDEEDVWKF